MYRFAFILFIALMTANAAETSVYSGNATVATEADRDRALQLALQQVLVKASGDTAIVNDPALPRKLTKASSLARHSTYRQTAGISATGSTINTWTLEAEFDPAGVAALLNELGRSLWSPERPTVLVWLAIDNGGNKQIASSFQMSALSALTAAASERGLSIELPRMDSTDLSRVDPVTLWDAPPATMIGASQRYAVKVIVVARLQKQDGHWTGRYTLIDGLEFEGWETTGDTADLLLADIVHGSADRIARRYTLASSGVPLGKIEVWLSNIESAGDYAKAVGYLSKLTEVRELLPVLADGNRTLIKLDIGVGLQRFKQLLAIDRVLVLEQAAGAANENFTLRLMHQ